MTQNPSGAKTALLQIYQDAWNGINGWVDQNLPTILEKTPFNDAPVIKADLGICPFLSSAIGDAICHAGIIEWIGSDIWEGDWHDNGDGTIGFSNLFIQTVSGLSTLSSNPQNAVRYANRMVNLPMSFSTITIGGDFSYSQNCEKRDYVVGESKQTMSGSGTLQQQISNGVINFYATVNDNGGLVFSSATVTGTSSDSGSRLTTQNPAGHFHTSELLDLITGSPYAGELQSALQSAFTDSEDVGSTVINAVNTALQSVNMANPGDQ